ncbi:type II toxin-antitoxin system antitoxin SocA domain-containing protein [Chryseobacterium sp. CT-SW4]|uniref:type II toxin-antitoxin system antitoxin SocA domain-containing protein n=1 Tax=Chryseobacterium sp. SW-1 TaxID=3157343 RepID=UPI003B0176BD
MYFADLKHLSKYGRKITEDCYVKMQNDPVPSKVCDILKGSKRGSSLFNIIGRYEVDAKCEYDEDELSINYRYELFR